MRTIEIINHLNAWQTRTNQFIEIDGEEYYQLNQEEVELMKELESQEE